MVSLKEIRKKAAERLFLCKNDSPLADIDYILGSLGFSKTDIILGEKTISAEELKIFDAAMERLKKGEPVQYIAGRCEFMSLEFEVSSATLIPRCDTEILVEAVIDFYKDKKAPKILEVGCGSGCVSVSLAHFLPDANIVAVDISKDAISVAKRNAERNNVADRVEFKNHNILDGFSDLGFIPDIVVSNPPYIKSEDIKILDKKVRDFEPCLALDGGEDGLDFYRFISKNAIIAEDGLLAFEVGIGQANQVSEFMAERFSNIKILKDLAGIERVVMGEL